MVAGIVLAAGRSSRMGRPKALLRAAENGDTFVARLLATFRQGGAATCVVVVREGDAALQAEVARRGARYVVNRQADAGQLSSLVAGLDAVETPALEGVLVAPVDMPLISRAAVAALLAAARASSAAIVRAVHEGQHGHPVLFTRAVFDELRNADPALGARAVVRRDPARVLDVPVGEAGVIVDVDTPEDYARIFGRPL